MRPSKHKSNYYIIDGNSYLYRAFFAIPKFTTSQGVYTNAVFGFTKMLLKLMTEHPCDHISVAFDAKGKTFRSEQFEDYKAHREKMPEELVGQIPYIHKIVELMGFPKVVIEGVEADDSIATFVALHRKEKDRQVYVITGDKDMMQMVGDNVYIYDTMKDVVYDRDGVKKKMGVYPEQIQDLLGLMGDSSDNIPGIAGVGPKTATKLLEEYDTLENVLEHAEDQKGALQKKLLEGKDAAKMSKELATVKTDIDLSHITFENTKPDVEGLVALCQELEFKSLLKDIKFAFESQFSEDEKEVLTKGGIEGDFRAIVTEDSFEKLYKAIFAKGEVAINVEEKDEQLMGISLSHSKQHAYFIPVDHPSFSEKLEKEYLLQKIKTFFESDGLSVYGHDMKQTMLSLENALGSIGETLDIPKQEEDQLSLF